MIYETKDQLLIYPLEDYPEEIGRWLFMLESTRRRTKRGLAGISQEAIDWQPPFGNSIGTLLYHIAAIEMDWVFSEVMEGHMEQNIWDNFPYEVRSPDNRLTVVTGLTLDEHFARLVSTRTHLLEAFKTMSLKEFQRMRHFTNYNVTPEWVLHHLNQHELEHLGEMLTMRGFAEKALEKES